MFQQTERRSSQLQILTGFFWFEWPFEAKCSFAFNIEFDFIYCKSIKITFFSFFRIMIRRGDHFDLPLSSTRLKPGNIISKWLFFVIQSLIYLIFLFIPDVVRGSLLSMKLLTLNRFLLIGTDSGNISLICWAPFFIGKKLFLFSSYFGICLDNFIFVKKENYLTKIYEIIPLFHSVLSFV